MLLTLTAIASLSIGYDLTRLIWPRDRENLPWAERGLYASIIGVSLWLASSWLLAFLHLLTRPAIIRRTIVFVLVAVVVLALRHLTDLRELARREFDPRSVLLLGVAVLPLFLWCIFILWRSVVVPPLSHDALAYHLPKAAYWIQAHGYDPLKEISFIIGPRPSNYEMMLADAILLDGDDTYTEWISTIFYLLFILATLAMTQRWWGDDPATSVAVALLTGGIPILLLHTGAHKNDVMAGYFMAAAAVAAGRFLATRELRAITLFGVACAGAAGTKQHGPILALFLAPFLLWLLRRAEWSVRRAAAIAVIAAVSVILLGGIYYLDRGSSVPVEAAPAAGPAANVAPPEPTYGDWPNLWIGPWVLLTGPFTMGDSIFVPGHGDWFWRRYEIYFSHLGVQFTLAVLLLAFCVWRYRREGTEEVRRERMIVGIATGGAFFALMPIHSVPFGVYVTNLPRFVLFMIPVLFGWTFAPLVRELVQRKLAVPALAMASFTFAAYAIGNGRNDTFVPLAYVDWARAVPGTRVIPFDPNRPASIVDRAAGPRDVVAIDSAASTWVYPAFGVKLQRRVILLPQRADGKVIVPDEAKWIVYDRSWHVIWGDKRFRNLSDAGKYLAQGELPKEDLDALKALYRDPRLKTVFIAPKMLEGVFVRRDQVPAARK